MALTLRRERNGDLRPYWYAEVQVDGVRRVKNLGVRWHGTPPSSLRGEGDEKFERSRVKALAKLEEVQEETKAKGQARHLTERLITAKTGKPVEYVKLEDLAKRWRGLTRERRTSDNWLAWCDSIFARFAEKVKVRYVHEVTSAMVAEFVAETRRKYARRTSRGAEQLLKSAFSRFLMDIPNLDLLREPGKDRVAPSQPVVACPPFSCQTPPPLRKILQLHILDGLTRLRRDKPFREMSRLALGFGLLLHLLEFRKSLHARPLELLVALSPKGRGGRTVPAHPEILHPPHAVHLDFRIPVRAQIAVPFPP
jgi:hypothetical protein